MSTFTASISWHLKPGEEFDFEHYHKDHEWTFGGGEVVAASASADFGGTPNHVNPDEAVVAAAASCHMLTFLAIAAKNRIRVISYIDQPEGEVGRNETGRTAITRIELRPRVVFDGEVTPEQLKRLHDSAHRNCFVANSLRADVVVVPRN